MSNPIPTSSHSEDSLLFADLGEGFYVIQVNGRGTFANSIGFTKLIERIAQQRGAGQYHFIIDLNRCETMDSTFMGALSAAALRQRRECQEPLVVTNANDHVQKLLDTLGVSKFVQMGSSANVNLPSVEAAHFQEEEATPVSKLDRIVHMIETHETLCQIDTENEARFENVLKYLRESLQKEKNGESDLV